MNKNFCPTCEFPNRAGNRFCTQCGSRLNEDGKFAARLVTLNGEKNSIIYALKPSKNILGREKGNTVVIPDEHVSKHHASIFYQENRYWIEDLGSKNGVYVNGERITGCKPLMDGCLIKVGSTILRFELQQKNEIGIL